ncbi:MAG TPA: zinc-binding alcohol dehydrogenase family protein [Acidobacteriaceae bacterium]|nr:zinc-binding alcohol dehydrogenase family protein [Acidobacteriaceae bacterium]
MNAAVVHSFSAPPRYDSFAEPVPTGEEVLISVTAAGLHPIVKSLAGGKHYSSAGELPFVPGLDGVGRLPDGSRVYFARSRPQYGSLAERSLTQRATCFPIGENLSDATVAAIMNPGMSSWGALTQRTRLAPGESLLILGATGVAGQLAVQVAKRLGARRVVAAGRNPEALEELRALGADGVISLAQDRGALVAAFREAIGQEKIDLVLDYLWGAPAEAVLEAMTMKGGSRGVARVRYVQVGSSAGPTVALPAESLRSSGLELMGSGLGSVPIEQIFRSLGEFLKEIAREPFRIQTTVAPLAKVELLWNAPEQGTRLVFQP